MVETPSARVNNIRLTPSSLLRRKSLALDSIQDVTCESTVFHHQDLGISRRYDYLQTYVSDLQSIIDMGAIRGAKISVGVDPLGGAGIDYWPLITERDGLDLSVVNESIDPTFRFVTVDWDGKIRMDSSSPYAMQRLIGLKDKFDIAFASDTDHDRHGIVTKAGGLPPPNHYLAVCIYYSFGNRRDWGPDVAVGKTVVSAA